MSALPLDRSRGSFWRRALIVAGAALVVDVLGKIGGVALLGDGSIGVGPVRLVVVRNAGFAFGIGANLSGGAIVVVIAIVVAVLVIAAIRGHLSDPAAAGLVLGGAIANLLDRGIDGTVVDLIDVGPWPTFNLADVSIVVGVALLLLRGGSSAGITSRPGAASPGPAKKE